MPIASLDPLSTLLAAIAAIFVGRQVNAWIPLLGRASIPPAVTGGLIACLLLALAAATGLGEMRLHGGVHAVLLPAFFATIGLGARLRALAAGGRRLAILCVVVAVLVAGQNLVGMGVAAVAGAPAGLGAFLGSAAFLGGHGTAAAWALAPQAAGLSQALPVGLAAATLGLILGGLVGGPVASRLLRDSPGAAAPVAVSATADAAGRHVEWQPTDRWLATLAWIAGALLLGEGIARLGAHAGFTVPAFLAAMLGGACLANVGDLARQRSDPEATEVCGTVALRIFLALALMSLDLRHVAGAFGLVLAAAAAQVALIVILAVYVLHPWLGRDREAAGTAGAFIGFGLGATPVAMGVVRRCEVRHGPLPGTVLLVTLAASFYNDLANGLILGLVLAR